MPKVAEVTIMEIEFENVREEENFVNWANDKSTVDQANMIKMREKLRLARELNDRIHKNWLKNQ